MSKDSRYFYRDIKALESFELAANGSLHSHIPDDWWVVVADISGSTKAIEDGRYKDVNTIGAATIMAVINVDRDIEIPFVFGGDGATLAVPDCMADRVREALLGAKKMAKDGFNMDLRVGLIPVKDISKRDLWLGVGKYQHSKKITQTSLSGFGWSWAEANLKDEATRSAYEVVETDRWKANANFTGFECRWRPVEARNGFKLAIIAQSTTADPALHADVYQKLLIEMTTIFGNVIDYHPLRAATLRLTLNPLRLLNEARVYAAGKSMIELMIYIFHLVLITAAATLMFALNLKVLGVRWGGYRREVADNADFRKFDGALKMVVDCSPKQEAMLRTYLETLRSDGQIIYGLHRSAQAIMTCLVFTTGQDHAHFVDGSDGGYAMAAKELKSQLAALKIARQT